MKKEQISFLSHSISPFFCLIWFLSSHLSFPPLFIYTLQSLPIAFLIFSFIFPFFLCPQPWSSAIDFLLVHLSCTFLYLFTFTPCLPLTILLFFSSSSLIFLFSFLSLFYPLFLIYSILSFLHSLSHIHPPLLFSLFYTSPEDMMNAEVIEW